MIKTIIYKIIQLTWGFPQTAVGFVMWLYHCARKRQHFPFKGALGTFWDRDDGVSLGMFIFVPRDADAHMIVHEYAHTIQSLMLGPLYLPVVGLCSMIWNRNPAAGRGWRSGKSSYYDFFTERWAESIGRKITRR